MYGFRCERFGQDLSTHARAQVVAAFSALASALVARDKFTHNDDCARYLASAPVAGEALTAEDVERQYRDGVHIGSGLPRATCPCGFCSKHRHGFERGDDLAAPQASQLDFTNAYEGAREDMAIWKRRALEAENLLRIERDTARRLVAELNAANGPTNMGEPAPQASEAVRTEALYLLREARALLPMFATAEAIGDWSEKVNRFAAGDVIDIPPHADKDGGDCAKGAGDVAMRDAAFEAVRNQLCKLPRYSFLSDGYGAVRRVKDRSGSWIVFDSAHALFDPVSVDAALSPTPSVVKQSLTATQTGEKGEKDAQ
ncbi:hypothetical protein [Achromobacter spanius]|uniref:hypothetical protein n=1 Tax=Achromobacter spanius TaxID=217203 RepID=UPI00197AEA64|nr:hypothetical protein [Achromobacter spanius]